MENKRIERGADPSTCPICGASYKQIVPELVKCPSCGFEEKSTFGIVKDYIEQNGIPTMAEVSKACKVPIWKIDKYLRSGKLEIPENSDVFIKCRNCGKDLRFGKYCKECAATLIRDMSNTFNIQESDIGEVPRKLKSKMHYINKE